MQDFPPEPKIAENSKTSAGESAFQTSVCWATSASGSGADSWGGLSWEGSSSAEERAVSREGLCPFGLDVEKTSARLWEELKEDQGEEHQGMLLEF